jgi:hypothetical protein
MLFVVSTAAPPFYGHRRQHHHGEAASLWSHQVSAEEQHIQHNWTDRTNTYINRKSTSKVSID